MQELEVEVIKLENKLMESIENKFPILEEEKTNKIDFQEKIILKRKKDVQHEFFKLESIYYMCSTLSCWPKSPCERYTFPYRGDWIFVDFPHKIMEKLELKIGKEISHQIYIFLKVLERKPEFGGITVESEEEVFLLKTDSNKKTSQTDINNKKILELRENSIIQKIENKGLTKSEKEVPFLVLITGGVASGKTTLAKQIKEWFEQNFQRKVLTISTDSYYSFSHFHFHLRNPNLWQIFEHDELNSDLSNLLEGKPIHLPFYDPIDDLNFKRSAVLVDSAPVIITEGIFALFDEEIRKKASLKIYVDVDDDLRLIRRLERHSKLLKEGKINTSVEYQIKRYEGHGKKNHELYVKPFKFFADFVVNNNNFEGNLKEVVEVIKKKLNYLENINHNGNKQIKLGNENSEKEQSTMQIEVVK